MTELSSHCDDIQTTAGLYVHWPYCQSKCRYCDFFSLPCAQDNTAELLQTYLADMDFFAQNAKAKTLHSIHLGGGTPSLMPEHVFNAILEKANKLWTLAENCEITAEVNPASGIKATLKNFKKAGFNRISIGVQSLNDDVLNMFGRAHNTATARKTVAFAQENFARVSADFIYARPGQTLGEWEQELSKIIQLGLKHYSLYQLTASPDDPWIKELENTGYKLPDDETQTTLYNMTQNRMQAANLPAYEISNHATNPDQFSRHNANMWQGGQYFGIGAGAHSRYIDQYDSWHGLFMPTNIEAWQNRNYTPETITAFERAEEMVILGLRLTRGVQEKRISRATGLEFGHILNTNNCAELVQSGLIFLDKNNFRLTDKGRILADKIAIELIDFKE